MIVTRKLAAILVANVARYSRLRQDDGVNEQGRGAAVQP